MEAVMSSNLERFFGGSPGGVLVKLLFLSLVVGAGLALLGFTPLELLRSITLSIRALLGDGLEALRSVGGWILTGAVFVVPIWLLSRLLARR
jgi:hypothetical protein